MIFQIDKGLKDKLQELTGLPENDVILSSNAFAFRNRLKRTGGGSVEFPFCNFRILPGYPIYPTDTFHKNYYLSQVGAWDSELKDNIKSVAYYARYECTFWVTNFVNAMQVFQNIYVINRDDILFSYDYIIKSKGTETIYTFKAPFIFTDLEFDPQWTAQEELDRGKIHSISLNFEVYSYIFFGANVLPPDEVIVDSFYNNETEEDFSDTDNVDRTVTYPNTL